MKPLRVAFSLVEFVIYGLALLAQEAVLIFLGKHDLVEAAPRRKKP